MNNESLANIFYYPAFQQMRIGKEQLIPSNIPLVGFSEMKVKPVRSDTLPVTIDAYPQ